MPPSDFDDQHRGDFFPPPSTPRRTRGGVRVQATRPEETRRAWWTHRWLAPIDVRATGERRARGWEYARSGQVMELHVQLGSVTAVVQGTRATPYEVRIGVEVFTQQEWIRVADALGSGAELVAALHASGLPDGIEATFAKEGLHLFPSDEELDCSCTCSDWQRPCRHVLAVGFLLGEALDRDPFLVLRLRGIERELLFALLERTGAPAAVARPPEQVTDHDPVAFWDGGDVVELAAAFDVQPPALDAPLVHVLGSLPQWNAHSAFVPTFERMLRRAGTDSYALDVALGVRPEQ